MELVNGYAGKPHVTQEDMADIYRGVIGMDSYVLPVGRKLESQLASNNLLKIYDGIFSLQGREVRIKPNNYEEARLDNGTQNQKRIDLVVARYQKNADTGIETVEVATIKGTAVTLNPVTPAYKKGNIRNGDTLAEEPLYAVEFNGISVVAVRPMFQVIVSAFELNSNINSKIVIEDESVTGTGVSWVTKPERTGYVLANAYNYGSQYNGTRVTKIDYNGNNKSYTVVLDANLPSGANIALRYIWIKK